MALGPYLELYRFLKPYRLVFVVGTLCGVFFGVLSGAIPLFIDFVGKVVFSTGQPADLAQGLRRLGPMEEPVRVLATDVLHLDEISKPFLVGVACLLIPAVMLLRSLLDFLNNYFSEWTSQRVLIDIRSKLMENLAAQSLDFFNETKAGTLFQKVVNETREVQSVLRTINTRLIAEPATIVSGLIVLFKLDWRFTLGALILLPCCIVPVLHLGKKVRQAARIEDGEGRELTVILHEFLTGIKVIKAYARTGLELARFHASGMEMFRQMMRTRRLMEFITPMVESLAALGVAIGLFYVYSVGMSGSTFLSLCFGIFLLYQPLKVLSRTHLILSSSHNVMTSVFETIHRKPAVCDLPEARKLEAVRGEIVFDRVTFSYREGIPALQGFSFTFEQGGYYALVGPSGAGKSTVLSLILRFYDPQEGLVKLDGQDVKAVTQDSLRQHIGIVTQDTFLFHDTIYRNIAYGKLEAGEEEVMEAARRAHAHEFILAQQQGYQTIIGDKGCMLSGGQQQRLAIARALLKDAPVLLLDEATSSLDSASERHIQAALEDLARGRTVIAIAHRLSTVLKADKILVMDQGRLLEAGSHSELLKSSEIYRKLYDLQFQGGGK